MPLTVTVGTFQLIRSVTPGTRPVTLLQGQEFVNLADQIRLVGTGGPVDGLLEIPFVPSAADVGLGNVANKSEAQLVESGPIADALAQAFLRGTLLVKNGAPNATDVPSGRWAVVKNTATGRISLFVNDGGTLLDLLNAPEF